MFALVRFFTDCTSIYEKKLNILLFLWPFLTSLVLILTTLMGTCYVLQWMKIDELFEQERNVRFAFANRMGVLGLMLHQTVDHNPLYPISVPDID